MDNNENRNNGKNETLEETTKAAIASKSETSEKNNESEGTNAVIMLQSKMALCPVHLPGQNVFCPGQYIFCPRQKFCPQLKNHFCSGETHFKPWTKFLSWTKNILS